MKDFLENCSDGRDQFHAIHPYFLPTASLVAHSSKKISTLTRSYNIPKAELGIKLGTDLYAAQMFSYLFYVKSDPINPCCGNIVPINTLVPTWVQLQWLAYTSFIGTDRFMQRIPPGYLKFVSRF
jgi:hypothetical protein